MSQPHESPYGELEASTYDQARESEAHWQLEYDYVQALLRRCAPTRFLDAPIGTGRFLPLCSGIAHVAGIDLSDAMLARSRERATETNLHNIDLVRGSMLEIPFSNGSFDLTLCCRFLHLVPATDLERVFAELARVTAGRVCVQAYVRGTTQQRLQSRIRRIWRKFVAPGSDSKAWSHIAAYTHRESGILGAAERAGLRAESTTMLERYGARRIMMYEWTCR